MLNRGACRHARAAANLRLDAARTAKAEERRRPSPPDQVDNPRRVGEADIAAGASAERHRNALSEWSERVTDTSTAPTQAPQHLGATDFSP